MMFYYKAYPKLIEQWRVVDKWWTDDPLERSFAEVLWHGRKIVFKFDKDKQIWRIVRQ